MSISSNGFSFHSGAGASAYFFYFRSRDFKLLTFVRRSAMLGWKSCRVVRVSVELNRLFEIAF